MCVWAVDKEKGKEIDIPSLGVGVHCQVEMRGMVNKEKEGRTPFPSL